MARSYTSVPEPRSHPASPLVCERTSVPAGEPEPLLEVPLPRICRDFANENAAICEKEGCLVENNTATER